MVRALVVEVEVAAESIRRAVELALVGLDLDLVLALALVLALGQELGYKGQGLRLMSANHPAWLQA